MDSGGIWPGDESYFQNIRETALQDTIKQLTKELAEARAMIECMQAAHTDATDKARAEIERLRARNAILEGAISDVTEEQSALCVEGQSITELVAGKDKLIEQMRSALEWYKDRVSNCNRSGDAGEISRDQLAKDVGKRAEAALSAAERGE